MKHLALAMLVVTLGCGSAQVTKHDGGPDAATGAAGAGAAGTSAADAGVDVAMDTPSAGGTAGATGSAGTGFSAGNGDEGAGDSVLRHHKNINRDGLYVVPALTKAAAVGLHKDATFTSAPLDGQIYAQPLFVDHFVDSGAAGKDLVIVATETNNVYALDAATGAVVWTRALGTPLPLAQAPCGNIDPNGVTGTPVIDYPSRTLFVAAVVTTSAVPKKHLVFALSLDDGAVKPGWPVDVAATAKSGSTSFVDTAQGQRGALAYLGGRVYVPYGGLFGDCGNFHGWLVSIAAADPSDVKAWATTAAAGGAWAPGGVSSDGTDVFMTTGNTFHATTWGGGEALLRFSPASLATPTYWAPKDWKTLDDGDLDIGGTHPVLVDLPGSTPSALALALGKDGYVRVLDRANLGGVADPVSTLRVTTTPIITAPVVYTTALATYVTFRGAGALCTTGAGGELTTLALKPGAPPTLMGSWCATQHGAGAPIVTTTDGHADAIVWSLGAEGDGLLHGFDGDTGAPIFAGTGVTFGKLHRFNAPIAAKGRLFVAADGGVVALTP